MQASIAFGSVPGMPCGGLPCFSVQIFVGNTLLCRAICGIIRDRWIRGVQRHSRKQRKTAAVV